MRNKIVASFFGWSNTGKTTLIERTLAALAERGERCGAIKCTRHPGSFQLPGRDSTRFFLAGAESAIVGGPETILALHSPERLDRAFLDRLFPEARFVLIEGGEVEGAVRVLTAGKAASEVELKLPIESVDIVVTGDSGLAARVRGKGVLCVAPEETGKFLTMLEEEDHGA